MADALFDFFKIVINNKVLKKSGGELYKRVVQLA